MRSRRPGCTYSNLSDPCTPLGRARTERRLGALASDFRGSVSFLHLAAHDSAKYNVHLPADERGPVFVWARLRAGRGTGSAALLVVVDQAASAAAVPVSSTAWRWERVEFERGAQAAVPMAVELAARDGAVEVDRLAVTRDALWRPGTG